MRIFSTWRDLKHSTWKCPTPEEVNDAGGMHALISSMRVGDSGIFIYAKRTVVWDGENKRSFVDIQIWLGDRVETAGMVGEKTFKEDLFRGISVYQLVNAVIPDVVRNHLLAEGIKWEAGEVRNDRELLQADHDLVGKGLGRPWF